MRIDSGMSLSENFNKKIKFSRQIINPLLDNLNEELINKKKEACFTNAQCNNRPCHKKCVNGRD